jgi:hypothetical protein
MSSLTRSFPNYTTFLLIFGLSCVPWFRLSQITCGCRVASQVQRLVSGSPNSVPALCDSFRVMRTLRAACLALSSTWLMSSVSLSAAGVSPLMCRPVVDSVYLSHSSSTTLYRAWTTAKNRTKKLRVCGSRRCFLCLVPSSLQRHNASCPPVALHSCLHATGHFYHWTTFCVLEHLRCGVTYLRTGMQARRM